MLALIIILFICLIFSIFGLYKCKYNNTEIWFSIMLFFSLMFLFICVPYIVIKTQCNFYKQKYNTIFHTFMGSCYVEYDGDLIGFSDFKEIIKNKHNNPQETKNIIIKGKRNE